MLIAITVKPTLACCSMPAVNCHHACLVHCLVVCGCALQSGEHLVPMLWVPEALETAMGSPVADMVNDSESMGVRHLLTLSRSPTQWQALSLAYTTCHFRFPL